MRVRVGYLLNRIDSLMATLASAGTSAMKWKAGLDAFDLMTVHLQQLMQSIKPTMRRYIVCPVGYDPGGHYCINHADKAMSVVFHCML